MKKITIFITTLLLLGAMDASAQSKKDIENQNEMLKQQNQLLMQMLMNQQNGNPNNPNNLSNAYGNDLNASSQQPDEDGFVEAIQSPIEKMCYEVGISEIRAFGSGQSPKETLARNMAEANAVAEIRRKIETYVRYGLDQFNHQLETQGQVGFEANVREQTVTAAKGIVQGANVVDSRKLYNPKTRMYKYEVCVKYDKAAILGEMEKQNQRLLKDEKQFEEDMMDIWAELDEAHGDVSLAEKRAQRGNEMEQDNLDRQTQRDNDARQQDADNEYRENESERQHKERQQKQSDDTNIKQQKQYEEAKTERHQQLMNAKVQEGYQR